MHQSKLDQYLNNVGFHNPFNHYYYRLVT